MSILLPPTTHPSFAVFAAALAVGLCGTPIAHAAPGDLSTRWPVNDADPMQGIPSIDERNADPLEFGYYIQDLIARAEGAFRQGDWERAIKYYRPLAVAVPDRAVGHQKLCEAYVKAQQWPAATKSCRQAMALEGARIYDHLFFLDAILRDKTLDPQQVAEIDASLEHLREYAKMHPQQMPGPDYWQATPAELSAADQTDGRPGSDAVGDAQSPQDRTQTAKEVLLGKRATQTTEQQIRRILRGQKGDTEPLQAVQDMHLPTQIELFNCKLGARIGDAARLTQCIERLRSYSVPAAVLLPFEWSKALAEKDEAQAASLLARAQQDGVPAAAIDLMRSEQQRLLGLDRKRPLWLALTAALGLLLLIGGYLVTQRTRAARTASAS